MHNNRALLLTGAVLRDPNVTAFDASKPYRYCRICGEVYQTETDRTPPEGELGIEHVIWAYEVEKAQVMWSVTHADKHHIDEHLDLANSGLYMTPKASHALAAYGVISLIDLVLDSETEHALGTAPATPLREVVDR